jgi:glycine cleavage system H protein
MEMVEYLKDRRYASSHEWVKLDGDEGLCGISDFAQHELSNVVYVELPEVGETFAKGDTFATVESVKAASDIYMPVSGEILAVNEQLADQPQLVNEQPFGEGWLVRFKASDVAEYDSLLDAEAYQKQCEEEKGGH